jgi:hypothetical protein
MRRTPFETGRLLQWLDQVLRTADGVDVDVVVMTQPDSRSSVQITLRGIPDPLGGLEVRPRDTD